MTLVVSHWCVRSIVLVLFTFVSNQRSDAESVSEPDLSRIWFEFRGARVVFAQLASGFFPTCTFSMADGKLSLAFHAAKNEQNTGETGLG